MLEKSLRLHCRVIGESAVRKQHQSGRELRSHPGVITAEPTRLGGSRGGCCRQPDAVAGSEQAQCGGSADPDTIGATAAGCSIHGRTSPIPSNSKTSVLKPSRDTNGGTRPKGREQDDSPKHRAPEDGQLASSIANRKADLLRCIVSARILCRRVATILSWPYAATRPFLPPQDVPARSDSLRISPRTNLVSCDVHAQDTRLTSAWLNHSKLLGRGATSSRRLRAGIGIDDGRDGCQSKHAEMRYRMIRTSREGAWIIQQ
jgi:hypothetical protein